MRGVSSTFLVCSPMNVRGVIVNDVVFINSGRQTVNRSALGCNMFTSLKSLWVLRETRAEHHCLIYCILKCPGAVAENKSA